MHRSHSLPSIAIALFLVLPGAAFAGAQTGERLSDRDVQQIVDDVNRARDRFEDQLDGSIKSSIVRGPAGEVSVSRYLDDLQENVAHLRERFSSSYAASKEAEIVLQQGTEIQRYMSTQPDRFKGQSEWDTLAMQLGRLAAAYRTTFPLPPGAVVRRMNDAEVASTADQAAKRASELKDQIGRESGLPKTARDAARKDVDAFIKQAKTVKSRASDAKPATAEMRELMTRAATLQSFVESQTLLPGTVGAWSALGTPLEALQQAYGLTPPPALQ
jgi:hypothetical protein